MTTRKILEALEVVICMVVLFAVVALLTLFWMYIGNPILTHLGKVVLKGASE